MKLYLTAQVENERLHAHTHSVVSVSRHNLISFLKPSGAHDRPIGKLIKKENIYYMRLILKRIVILYNFNY